MTDTGFGAVDGIDPAEYPPRWWDEMADERVAKLRAQYIDAVAPWRGDNRPISLALAYRRLGYSHSGIAKRIGMTEGTIDDYMDEVVVHYGSWAIESAYPDELDEWPDGPFPPEGGQ